MVRALAAALRWTFCGKPMKPTYRRSPAAIYTRADYPDTHKEPK